MTKGALIFAFNNQTTDYVSLARWSADNIRRHLGIPVALVTDNDQASGFDVVITAPSGSNNRRYFADYDCAVDWYNLNRSDAYALTPWQHTLVLDADYVVASDRLNLLFDADQDFLAHRWAYDATSCNDFQGLNYFGRHRMPQWWATIMCFRKSNHSAMIFDLMKMIRNNWTHYRDLYAVRQSTYRNDHALTIALNTVNGHTDHGSDIPWPMTSVLPQAKVSQLTQDVYEIKYTDSQNIAKRMMLTGMDFHAMGKRDLESICANH